MNRNSLHSQQFLFNPKPEQTAIQNNDGQKRDDNHLVMFADRVLLTAEEVAEILRVPRSWIYSHLDQLPTVRLGRYVRFKRSEIQSFLGNDRTPGPGQPNPLPRP